MPYRDDQTAQKALQARRDELQQDLAEIRGRTAALDELHRAQAGLERELAEVEQRLTRSAERRLRLLDDVRVASPCDRSWEDMRGDERVRFCEGCRKDVYNLSAMTRDEAEELINEREGRVCVRLYRREDGTVLTADCAVGARKKRVRRLVFGAAAGAGAAVAATWALMDGDPPPPVAPAAVLPPAPVDLVQDPAPPPPPLPESPRKPHPAGMHLGALAP
jgi:hypothetical protein